MICISIFCCSFFSLSLTHTASCTKLLITHTQIRLTLKTVAPIPQPQIACRTTITSIHSFTNNNSTKFTLFSSLFLPFPLFISYHNIIILTTVIYKNHLFILNILLIFLFFLSFFLLLYYIYIFFLFVK